MAGGGGEGERVRPRLGSRQQVDPTRGPVALHAALPTRPPCTLSSYHIPDQNPNQTVALTQPRSSPRPAAAGA